MIVQTKDIKKAKIAVKPVTTKSAISVPVFTAAGIKSGSFDVPAKLFSVNGSDKLLTQYVHVYQTNQRQGTHATKSRGEVVGSTRKIYRQKGTGRARHGAKSAPIFVGGGVAFGPTPADYHLSMNKKQVQKTLFTVLTSKVKEGAVSVISGLTTMEPKTKKAATLLNKMTEKNIRSLLLIYPTKNSENIVHAVRNIAGLQIRPVSTVNAFDIIKNKSIIFTKEALEEFISVRSASQAS